MPQAIDEAGNIWEVDAQGRPVRFIGKQGGQQSAAPTVVAPNAQRAQQQAREQSRQDASLGIQQANSDRSAANEAARIQLQRDSAARDWAAKVADMQAKGFMLGPDGQSFVKDPNWTPEPKEPVAQPTQQDLEAVRNEALQKLQLIDSLAKRSREGYFATGFGAGTASSLFPSSTAGGVARDVESIGASGALAKVMDMARQNGGKNPLTPLSEGDFANIGKSIANLDPKQSDADFQRNLDTYRSLYLRAFQGAGGKLGPDGEPEGYRSPDRRAAVSLMAPGGQSGSPPGGGNIPGGPGGGQPLGFAQGERYSTPEDIATAQAIQKAYNAGGSVQDMFDAAKASGYTPNAQDAQGWQAAIRYRDDPKNRGRLSTVEPRQTGVRTSLMGVRPGEFSATPLGAAGMGMANAWTMGGLDEIAGGLNSLASGRTYEGERDWANLGKQATEQTNGGAYLGGNIVGGITQGVGAAKALNLSPRLAEALNSIKGIVGTGAGYGAVNGALEDNQDRLGGGAVGAAAGAGGALLGIGAGRAAEALMRTRGGQAISNAARDLINRTPGLPSVAPTGNVPDLNRAERLIGGANMQGAITNLRDADRLGLPYTPADASEELRNLAGSATRLSPDGRAMAERILDPRQRGQADRAREGIDSLLAPITDIDQRGRDLLKAGNTASSPYYRMAEAQNVPGDAEISALLNTPAGQDALKRAHSIARNQGRDPDELGFIVDDRGNVGLSSQQGRFSKATAPNERGQLDRYTVRSYTGQEVPVAGPIDLAGWIRLNGGLKDQGGELSHMGLNNASRRGDMIGQETRFGPLVNEQGMSLDDAAMRAWEAGYFPGMTDRPDVNTFLDTFRDTHDGVNRRFKAEDLGQIDQFNQARDARYQVQQGRTDGNPLYLDNSVGAGPDRPFAPMSAYGEKEVPLPTFETLDLVKKGLDARIQESADAFGNINFSGNPELQAIEGLRQRLVSRLDVLNENYPKARGEYAKYAKRKDALDNGLGLTSGAVPQRKFDAELSKAQQYDGNFRQPGDALIPEMQRGYATGMADQVDKMRLSANPFEAIYGSPNQQSRVSALFPDGAADFGRSYDLERDMTKTAREVIGGSPTAARMAADASMAGDLATNVIDAGTQVATGGGAPLASITRGGLKLLAQTAKFGVGKKAEERAGQVAKLLLDTNPAAALAQIDSLQQRMAQDAARKQTFKKRYGLFGAVTAPVTSLYLNGQ